MKPGTREPPTPSTRTSTWWNSRTPTLWRSSAAIPAPRDMAAEFGVIEASADGRIQAFHEKNPNAPPMPDDPNRVFASMGNYVFNTRTLLKLLRDDAAEDRSQHDFGH